MHSSAYTLKGPFILRPTQQACVERKGDTCVCMQAGAWDAGRKVDVLCAEERSSAYLNHDLDKNIFGSFYHVREPKTRRLPMTVPDFAVCLKTWTSKKLLLKV